MHLSRRQLLDDFLTFVGEGDDADARNVAERLLNKTLTALWLKYPWSSYRSPVPYQLTLTANRRRYSLPDYFGRVGPGQPRNLTRGTPLRPLQPGDLERFFPQAGTSFEVADLPRAYEIAGVSGVHTQPAATGDALTVVSDSAADTDIVVAITGDDISGRWTRRQVALLGLTAVAIGTWTFVDELGKAYQFGATPVTELTSSRGTVTLKVQSSGAELQSLFLQESSKEHQILTVYPKPSAADQLAIPVIRRPKRLLFDADPIPDLWEPALWEELLIEWKVNRGELNPVTASSAPRPAFIDLVAHENSLTPRPISRPYVGMSR